MPRSENMLKGLPYYPPNGKESFSTKKISTEVTQMWSPLLQPKKQLNPQQDLRCRGKMKLGLKPKSGSEVQYSSKSY